MLVILYRKGDGEVITGSQKRKGAQSIHHGICSPQETDLSVGRAMQDSAAQNDNAQP